jgi:hypothetical protein
MREVEAQILNSSPASKVALCCTIPDHFNFSLLQPFILWTESDEIYMTIHIPGTGNQVLPYAYYFSIKFYGKILYVHELYMWICFSLYHVLILYICSHKLENLKQREHLGVLDVDGRIILEWITGVCVGVDWIRVLRIAYSGGFL